MTKLPKQASWALRLTVGLPLILVALLIVVTTLAGCSTEAANDWHGLEDDVGQLRADLTELQGEVAELSAFGAQHVHEVAANEPPPSTTITTTLDGSRLTPSAQRLEDAKLGSFSGGCYLVGDQIPVGRYRIEGDGFRYFFVHANDDCTDTVGGRSGTADEGQQLLMTLRDGDVSVEFEGRLERIGE